MFGRNKGDSINLDDPGKVTVDSAYYKELIAAENELVVLRNEKEDWLEDRAGVIEKQNDLNAEIERLQREIDSLFKATLHDTPEKPKRTWRVCYGWGRKRCEAIVTAQSYTLNHDDAYVFANEVRTGKAFLSTRVFTHEPILVYETEYVFVAEFSGVISVVELTE